MRSAGSVKRRHCDGSPASGPATSELLPKKASAPARRLTGKLR